MELFLRAGFVGAGHDNRFLIGNSGSPSYYRSREYDIMYLEAHSTMKNHRVLKASLLVLAGVLSVLAIVIAGCQSSVAELMVPAIFTDNMVLQRDQANPIWGWDSPGSKVKVAISNQSHVAVAASDGKWSVKLNPMKATRDPLVLTIKGTGRLTITNVLVGEVWLCSGQSNMEWPLRQSRDADIELAEADYPLIRLISVPRAGTQVPQRSFRGAWRLCTPKSAADFSAVGYFFGRRLHRTIKSSSGPDRQFLGRLGRGSVGPARSS